MTAPHVGDGSSSGPQPGIDTFEGGDPFGDQAAEVPGLEEPLDSVEEVIGVGMPPDAGPAAEGQAHQLLVLVHRRGQGHGPGEKGRGGFVGQHRRLLVAERETARGGVILAIAAHELGIAPFLDQSPVVSGSGRQLLARDRPLDGQRLVEAEFVPDHDGGTMHGGPEVRDESADQLVEGVFVDRHGRISSRWGGSQSLPLSLNGATSGVAMRLQGSRPREIQRTQVTGSGGS